MIPSWLLPESGRVLLKLIPNAFKALLRRWRTDREALRSTLRTVERSLSEAREALHGYDLGEAREALRRVRLELSAAELVLSKDCFGTCSLASQMLHGAYRAWRSSETCPQEHRFELERWSWLKLYDQRRPELTKAIKSQW